ncbi:RNA 2',3'-cyclic phosphodiesterase [Rhodovarius lipocyclicus]|jgi:2'-5' RNA ligase|uniref:RNA 2',3'-cyclic phosphodiesterase n=1 Tax=Rhodovarius lipocyclicus TaxID=268410 RepID=UPI00191796A8|nr:RNA 2',3'-cyclic phosphodiesterase [Rhodovarius lipocyclicus]
MPLRLFVALSLPETLRQELSTLGTGIPGAKWIRPANYHLTLRFVGEIQNWKADEVDEALSGIRARGFELTLRGLGLFERMGRPSALWTGAERNDSLNHLQTKIETALRRVGLSAERRRFAPHVSLARVEQADPAKIAAYLQRHNLFRARPVAVESFTLYSSLLGKECATYVPEVEYELAPRRELPERPSRMIPPHPVAFAG